MIEFWNLGQAYSHVCAGVAGTYVMLIHFVSLKCAGFTIELVYRDSCIQLVIVFIIYLVNIQCCTYSKLWVDISNF